jgi:hypothetical protein
VLASFAVRYAFARHMVAPWIMIDEIVYSELAKSFAATGHFAVREVPTTGYGYIYPILISPAYRIANSVPDVYAVVHVFNAFLVSLAAVPAYLLARRVVSPNRSLVVAALTVAVPSTFYAGTFMTENAFYPIFLLAALALVAAVERPSPVNVAAALGAIALAYLTRAQAIALFPALLTAPLLRAVWARRARMLLEYRWLYGTVATLGLVVVLAQVVRGRGLSALLGAYAVTTEHHYAPLTVAKWLLWHLGEIDLYVGVAPVFALVVLVCAARRLAAREQAMLATILSLGCWLSLEVAAFATLPSVQRIEERNLFYLAPLLFVALALWMERGLPRPRWAAAGGAIVAVGLVACVPYDRFIGVSATSDTLGLLPLWSLKNWLSIPLPDVRWAVAAVGAVIVAIALRVPPRMAVALPALIAVLYVLAAQPIDKRTQRASIGALFQGVTRPHRDWVRDVVRTDEPNAVAFLWSGATDSLTVFENEFFNRAVGDIYTLDKRVPGGLKETPIHLDRRTGDYLISNGKPAHVRYLLSDTPAVAGRRIAADAKKGLLLLRVDGTLRSPYVVNGLYADGWTGRNAELRRFHCRGGQLHVELGSDPNLFRRDQIVTVREQGLVVLRLSVAPSGTTNIVVPLRPGPPGQCRVRFEVERTAVPALVHPGALDTRRLGVRLIAFQVRGAR